MARAIAAVAEGLEGRTLFANLAFSSASLVDASGNALSEPLVVGTRAFLKVNYSTFQTAPGTNYKVNATVYGQTYTSPVLTAGAGISALRSWSTTLGPFFVQDQASPAAGAVVVDPENTRSETSELDNAGTFSVTSGVSLPLPSTFTHPLGVTPLRNYGYAGYVDLNPGVGVLDYKGGSYALEGSDGIDMVMGRDDLAAPVYAAAAGTVVEVSDERDDQTVAGPGETLNYVLIDHGNGWFTRYTDFRFGSVSVAVGDSVIQGQRIGTSGSGTFAGRSHLRFSVYHGLPVETYQSPETYWQVPVPYQGAVNEVLITRLTDTDPTASIAAGRIPDDRSYLGIPQRSGRTLYYTVSAFVKAGATGSVTFYKPDGTVYDTQALSTTASKRGEHEVYSTALPTLPDVGAWKVTYVVDGVVLNSSSVQVRSTPISEAEVSYGGVPLQQHGRFVLDGGTLAVGATGSAYTFTVRNHGNSALVLNTLDLPHEWNLSEGLSSSIAPGASDTFTITPDTSSLFTGTRFGSVYLQFGDSQTYIVYLKLAVTPAAGLPVVTASAGSGSEYPLSHIPFRVYRTGSTASALTVLLSTSSTGNWLPQPVSVTIPAGASSVRGIQRVVPTEDYFWNGSPYFQVTINISQSSSYDRAYLAAESSTILNRDVYPSTPILPQDKVYLDSNGDTYRQPNEVALSGIRAFLDRNRNGVYDVGEVFSFTDSTGKYSFTSFSYDIRLYVPIRLELPAGYHYSTPPGELLSSSYFGDLGVTVDPTVLTIGGAGTVAEGASLALTSSYTGATPTGYQWDFDYDGVTFNADATGSGTSFSAVGIDGLATRTVALRALLSGGLMSDVVTKTITISNAAPVAALGVNGRAVTVSPVGGAYDYAGDSVTLSWDYDNDGVFEVTGVSLTGAADTRTVPLSLLTSGSTTVRAVLTDEDGGTSSYTATVSIPVPTAVVTIGANTVVEGTAVTFVGTSSFTSGGSGIALYEWDADYDGTFEVSSTGATLPLGALDGPASRMVALRVATVDGLTSIATASVTVTNAAPVGTVSASGRVITVTPPVGGLDVSGDTVTIAYDFDRDGVYEASGTATTATVPLAYFTNGIANVRVRLTDEDGGTSTYDASLTIPVPGAVIEASALTVNEGGSVTFTGEAGAASVALYEWDNDFDGVNFEVTSTGAGLSLAGLASGVRRVGLRVTTVEGLVTVGSALVTVANVAPTATFGVNGTSVGFTNVVDFAGDLPGVRYSFDFGDDGVFEIVDSTSASVEVPVGFRVPGTTTNIRGRVSDAEGGATTYLASLTTDPTSPPPTSPPPTSPPPTSPPPPSGPVVRTVGISGPSTVAESAGTIVYTVTLSSAFDEDVAVTLLREPGSVDGQPVIASVPPSVVVPAGATSVTFNVALTDDSLFNPGRSLGVRVTANEDKHLEVADGAGVASVSVLNDDVVTAAVADPTDPKKKKQMIRIDGSDMADTVTFLPGKGGVVMVSVNGGAALPFARRRSRS